MNYYQFNKVSNKVSMQEIKTHRRKKSDKAKEKQDRFGKYSKKHIREMNNKQSNKDKNTK